MRNGKITIFGGRENKRQMSVVENCEIRRVTTMPFEFRLGGCVTDDSEGKNIETHTASKAKDLNRLGAQRKSVIFPFGFPRNVQHLQN